MSEELILLCLRGERALEVKRFRGTLEMSQEPVHQHAAQEFGRLLDHYPDAHIAWYDVRLKPFLKDVSGWPELLRHPLEILHLSCFQRCDVMVDSLGLVDCDSPFLLPGPQDRRFATTLISPMCGIGRAPLFRAAGFDASVKSFAVALFELGLKDGTGICPYSEPRLLIGPVPSTALRELQAPLNSSETAILVRRVYGKRWLLFWLLGMLLLRRSLPLLGVVRGWRAGGAKSLDQAAIEGLHPKLPERLSMDASIDAIIPTLARPSHVENLLRDLSAQTLPPRRVVLIEQNPNEAEHSLLSDVLSRDWPFELVHHCVSWVGACRARNLGLKELRGDWVLLLDDDIRLTPDFISYLLKISEAYAVEAVNGAVYLLHEKPEDVIESPLPQIWPRFGTGSSLIKRRAMEAAGEFDERLEGGFGEDYEYGVRLRLQGANILYAPGEPVLHLKAPSGGFRHALTHPWQNDKVPPRPSPVVLYSRRKNLTQQMQQGYLLLYWIKRLLATPVLRWPWEVFVITRQWQNSIKWAAWLALRRNVS